MPVLNKIDVEGHEKWLTRALSLHNICYTLFVKDLAVAQLQSAPLVGVYGISIGNRSGCTFRHFAFYA